MDIKQHEYYLRRILRDVIRDEKLSSQLVFKGGTCLYLFYGLGRFSVDLDFSLKKDDFSEKNMDVVLKKYLDVENGRKKKGKYGWLWEASYKKGYRKMQVDVSSRNYPDKYEVKQFYGLSMQVMKRESLFAHKLCAVIDRNRFQNRDLYDVWFMLDKNFPIDEDIVQFRTGKSVAEYLVNLIKYVEKKVDRKNILHGLGELIDEKSKVWTKNYLIDELLANLKIRSEVSS